jgi:hypothetical protein
VRALVHCCTCQGIRKGREVKGQHGLRTAWIDPIENSLPDKKERKTYKKKVGEGRETEGEGRETEREREKTLPRSQSVGQRYS